MGQGFLKMDGKDDGEVGPGGSNRKSVRARTQVQKFTPGMEDKDKGATKKKKDKEKGNREVTKGSGNQKQAAVETTEEDKSYVKIHSLLSETNPSPHGKRVNTHCERSP